MRVSSSGRLAVFLLSLLALAALPALASAATPAQIEAAKAKAETYLKGKVAESGEPSDPEGGIAFEHSRFGADWSAIALAAVGVNAADATNGGPSLQDFLSAEYGSPTGELAGPSQFAPEEWSRLALIAHAAGLETSRVSATVNLPARIAGKWNQVTGSFGGTEAAAFPTPSALGLLGLVTSATPRWALAPAIAKLRELQEPDGGWTEPGGFPRAETTGIVLAALCEAGVPGYDPAVQAGVAYLHGEKQPGTGAIEATNTESTAIAVMGMNACGVDLEGIEWRLTGSTPLDYLISLQTPTGAGEGGFPSEVGETPNLYASTFATLALAGDGFVVEPPPREDAALPSLRPAPIVADGTPVAHELAIEGPSGVVRMCSVEGPSGASLGTLLTDAQAAAFPSYPEGCVGSFSYEGSKLATLNGQGPENADQSWVLRLDRGNEAVAAEQPVPFGDVIALRVGATPVATVVGPQGPEGATGATGPSRPTGVAGATGETGPVGQVGPNGPAGKRGARGSAGKAAKKKARKAQAKVRKLVCVAAQKHAKNRERRCVVRHKKTKAARRIEISKGSGV